MLHLLSWVSKHAISKNSKWVTGHDLSSLGNSSTGLTHWTNKNKTGHNDKQETQSLKVTAILFGAETSQIIDSTKWLNCVLANEYTWLQKGLTSTVLSCIKVSRNLKDTITQSKTVTETTFLKLS